MNALFTSNEMNFICKVPKQSLFCSIISRTRITANFFCRLLGIALKLLCLGQTRPQASHKTQELGFQEGNAIYLYNLSSKLWRPVLQVMPVDGKHSVVAAEPAILSSQSPFQEVKNEDSRLICPANEFNAKLLAGVAFVQRDLEAVLPRGGGGGGLGVAVRAAPEAPLSQHGEVQHRARLRQHSSSVVVGHIADVKAIHLKKKKKRRSECCSYVFNCSSLWT